LSASTTARARSGARCVAVRYRAVPSTDIPPSSRPHRYIVTVTKYPCVWCGRRFVVRGGAGRPRRYCRQSCRQRDYEARRRSAELGLSEGELVITRAELESVRD